MILCWRTSNEVEREEREREREREKERERADLGGEEKNE